MLVLILVLLKVNNAFAVTEFLTTFCTSGCDYTAASTAATALGLAGNIKSASNLAKTGSYTTLIGSAIADNTAITWDVGARSGTLIHMTSTQYLIKCATTTDCTNLGDTDIVSDGTNTFVVSGAPDSPIIRINCHENATFTDAVTISMGSATNSNSTNYMILGVDSAYRHDGTSSTGCRISSNTNAFTVTLGSHSSTVEWLRLAEASNGASDLGCLTMAQGFGQWNLGGRNLIVENCNSSGSGNWRGVVIGHSANTGNPVNYLYNSIVYNSEKDGVMIGNLSTGADYEISNVTTYGNGQNGISAGGSGLQTLKNDLSCGNVTADYAGSYDTFTTSGSCDATGTSGLTGLSSSTEFTNTGSNDYHLKAGATSIDTATSLGSTNNINIDIDNYTRTGTWDLGADEFVSSGATEVNGKLTLQGVTIKGAMLRGR